MRANEFLLAKLLKWRGNLRVHGNVITKVVGESKKGFDLLAGFRNRQVVETRDLFRIRSDLSSRDNMTENGQLSAAKSTLVKVESEIGIVECLDDSVDVFNVLLNR